MENKPRTHGEAYASNYNGYRDKIAAFAARTAPIHTEVARLQAEGIDWRAGMGRSRQAHLRARFVVKRSFQSRRSSYFALRAQGTVAAALFTTEALVLTPAVRMAPVACRVASVAGRIRPTVWLGRVFSRRESMERVRFVGTLACGLC